MTKKKILLYLCTGTVYIKYQCAKRESAERWQYISYQGTADTDRGKTWLENSRPTAKEQDGTLPMGHQSKTIYQQ